MKAVISICLWLSISSALFAQAPTSVPDKPEVVFVKGGTFKMGTTKNNTAEIPVHRVKVSDFLIGKYEVTVSQYRAFCKETGRKMPSKYVWGWFDNYPIDGVTHNDAVDYCSWLSKKFGGKWRLPAEAEWEYAARGGSQNRGSDYSGGNDLNRVGWYKDNSGGSTHSVGGKKANELGVFDMSGNVLEMCSDTYGVYIGESQTNPTGADLGPRKVTRGGNWDTIDVRCQVAARFSSSPSFTNSGIGFRVVLSQ